MKALIHPLIHSLTHSFIHSPTLSFIQTLVNALLHLFIHGTHSTRILPPEDRRIGGNWENSLVRTRWRCVHVTLRQSRML